MIGSGIGITQVACRGGAAAFSPLSLFSSGEEGAWYDPSDLSTLFQDAAGTTPVTADSQPVRLMLDKSGNANHATAPSDAARPLYKTAGGLHWLEFDGVDDELTGAHGFSVANDRLLVAALGNPGVTTSSTDLHLVGLEFGTTYIRITLRPLTVNRWGAGARNSEDGIAAATILGGTGSFPVDSAAVIYTRIASNVVYASYNGGAESSQPFVIGANTAVVPTQIGSTYSFGSPGFEMYGYVYREQDATADERAELLAYLAEKSGVTLP